jgi:hypothetical protein
MTAFTEKDIRQLDEKGISRQQVAGQIEIFETGIPFVRLEKAAVIGDGIIKCTPAKEKQLIATFEKMRPHLSLLKFVPASGAASRMFKALFNFLDSYDPGKETLKQYLDRTGDKAMKTFLEGMKNLPFYDDIRKQIKGKAEGTDMEAYLFVEEMLKEDRLNYGNYPKGLLPFHRKDTHVATPFEEHLYEAAAYASVGKEARLHFTISEQHEELFEKEFQRVKELAGSSTKTTFSVSYSYQKSSTDTIAVTPGNKPFRDSNGDLLFRPGGHGALIENLDEQDADLIFIKNVDNVVVPSMADKITDSKKMLAGLLLQIQEKAHHYASLLDGDGINGDQLQEIKTFLEKELNVRFSDSFTGFSVGQQLEILRDKINRPIRVCGMVKNEGEPGGGPFWVRDRNGHVSLQIIESAQVDLSNDHQVAIFKDSTHFNPVDIVCGVKDHKGEKYHLQNFVDTRQGFITGKTKEGQPLKALELPGLWNGAMAFWNTLFVEVPLHTFNPVKTVNDLLKPAHSG